MRPSKLIDDYKAGIVDSEKLKGLIDDAFEMARDAAAVGDTKTFCELTKIIQAQQKLDQSAGKKKPAPFRQEEHQHLHLNLDGSDNRRNRLADILTRLGVPEASQSYLAD